MGTLVKFELRKILGNRAGMAACALALALLAAIAVVNLASANTRDLETGEVAAGFEAQQAVRRVAESHAGVLDDARVAADAGVLDRANELARQVEGFYDLSNQEVIDAFGLEFWQQTYGVISQPYYNEVVGTLDAASPRASSLREGADARIGGALENRSAGYSAAERDYWKAKSAEVAWPVEYGYAGGWDNVLDWMSFSGLAIVALCIAISGVFAGEYQARTAAVVLPTRRGKRALPAAKVIAALAFATVYYWLCALIAIGVNIGVCGADGWNLPLQVVFGFDCPYPLTVGRAVVLLYLLGYLIALGMAALTLLLSARMRSTMPVAVISMAVVFLGLVALFVDPLVKVGLLTPLSGLNYAFSRMASYAAGSVVADLPTVLAALYGIMLVAFVPLAMRAFKRHQVA